MTWLLALLAMPLAQVPAVDPRQIDLLAKKRYALVREIEVKYMMNQLLGDTTFSWRAVLFPIGRADEMYYVSLPEAEEHLFFLFESPAYGKAVLIARLPLTRFGQGGAFDKANGLTSLSRYLRYLGVKLERRPTSSVRAILNRKQDFVSYTYGGQPFNEWLVILLWVHGKYFHERYIVPRENLTSPLSMATSLKEQEFLAARQRKRPRH